MNISTNTTLSWVPFSETQFFSYHLYSYKKPTATLLRKATLLDFVRLELILLAITVILFINLTKRKANKTKSQEDGATVEEGKSVNRIKNLPRVRPTPFNIPYLDGVVNLIRTRNMGITCLEDWAAVHGKVFELPLHMTPTTLTLISDPKIVQKVLLSTEHKIMNKPVGVYKTLAPPQIYNGLVGADVENWSRIKKTVFPIFTYKSLLSYIPLMNRHASSLISSLSAECASNLDGIATGDGIYNKIYLHTIKIIMEILLGPGCFNDEQFLHESVKRGKEIIQYRFENPLLLFEFLWWFHPFKREYAALEKSGIKLFQKKINHHKENLSLKKEKLKIADGKDDEREREEVQNGATCLIEEMLKQNLPDQEILDGIASLILPGYETSTMSVGVTLFLLAKHPECQTRAQQEIDAIFFTKTKAANETENVSLTMDDLGDMRYLENCVLESMRLIPVIPGFCRQVDAPFKIDGETEFEQGRVLFFSPWVSHHDPDNFPEPKKYDPDRFLPENVSKRHPGAYIPFSRGPRNCIGWKIAMVEMKLILAYLLHHFELSTTDELSDVKINHVLTIEMERYFNLSLKKRIV